MPVTPSIDCTPPLFSKDAPTEAAAATASWAVAPSLEPTPREFEAPPEVSDRLSFNPCLTSVAWSEKSSLSALAGDDNPRLDCKPEKKPDP